MIFVDGEKCLRCGMCVRVCPADAFLPFDGLSTIEINRKKCMNCRECVGVCPVDALTVRATRKRQKAM